MSGKDKLFQEFKKSFGYLGQAIYFSPGRINLIGEHTDYNGGKVFPCAISMGTYGVVAPREDKEVHAISGNFTDMGVLSFSLEDIQYKKESNWTNYVKGMLLYIQEVEGALPHGFDLYIYGNIPNGAGLSSSASLEVLTGIIANDLYGFDLSGEMLAKIGMRVENEFLNLNSGIMDQFIIANAKKDHAILLDTNTLQYQQISLDLPYHKIVIMNSLARRELVDSEYNVRREQCEAAVEMLQQVVDIQTLGDLTESEFEQHKDVITDSVIKRRVKHAVYENARTDKAADALKNKDLELFGQLMNASHLSLHEDYEVTVPETDVLVRFAWEEEGVVGARMTGGGFGGSCIAIVENDSVDKFIRNVSAKYADEFKYEPEMYIAKPESRANKMV